jgi:ribosomal protein L37AE/L43A
MSDAFDDRRRGLEEEYFHRQNQELIEKMRAQMKASAEAKAAATAAMQCPRCDGTLKETKVDEVSIDTCEKCGGVWLDSGELEQLTKREGGSFFGRLWGNS